MEELYASTVSIKNNDFEVEGVTHCIGDIDVFRWNLSVLPASFFNRTHIPDTEGSSTQLSPNILPSFVFGRSISIRASFYSLDHRPREIHLSGMRLCEVYS